MAIDESRTRMRQARELPLLSTATIGAEGICMQGAFEALNVSTVLKVLPSNATANTKFEGFTWGQRYSPPATKVIAELVTASSTGLLSTSYTPVGFATTGVFTNGYGGAALAGGSGAPGANAFQAVAGGIQLNVSQAGNTFLCVYSYNLTVIQQQSIYGDAFPGPTAVATNMQTGLFTHGTIYTDMFDATVDWSTTISAGNAYALTGGANGLVTIGGVGCLLNNVAEVVEIPSITSPWLGLYVHA